MKQTTLDAKTIDTLRDLPDMIPVLRESYESWTIHETVGNMRALATELSYKQPGDPEKLAQAFIKLAAAENPPVHLPLGSDTLQRFREKTAAFEKDIEAWYDVVVGTDHDDVKQAK